MTEPYPMLGKTVLITGATAGIGAATAARLYAMGARVILHGRNPARLAAAIEKILRLVPEGAGRLDVLTADFEVMAQVYAMVEAFQRRYDRLDVLINNAGAFYLRRQETPDGFEKTFAVNYLAHFLLTTRLLPILKASAPARIITVSSDAHFQAKLDFSDLMLKKKYRPFTAYANAKLYSLLFAYELARRFRRTPNLALTSNIVHPGFVATEIGKNNGALVRFALNMYQRLPLGRWGPRRPEEGADTVVYLASDPEAAAYNGKYFFDRHPKATSVPSYDHDAAAHLWGVSEMLVQRSVPVLQTQAQDVPTPAPQAAELSTSALSGTLFSTSQSALEPPSEAVAPPRPSAERHSGEAPQ